MNIIEYADRELLAMSVANVLAGELRKCLTMHDYASFAVPGGTTPAPIFDMMSSTDLAWDRVHVMLTDERWVPEDDEQSNTGLIKRHLLTGRAASAQLVPFYRDGKTSREGAAEVAPTLKSELPISLLMLGMGADMHTASLFPGGDGLEAAMAPNAPLLCPVSPVGMTTERVTLPAHALAGAMSKHLVIFGDEKRAALERAQTLPAHEAPIGAVMAGGTVHWAA
ncbi:6-phosphogluconolactonase [Sulfitobacter noctilucicola]|uniref:6-phosphogluconolactonase n=1 Tax=Sulfitobacter noctilucicola TaxID=1342301 RepID=A0A7W6M802_9RHOB|nr:6-phosphogluconolactonase [Sulfitobacter noctilucicola]KIN65099.1 6-phosphogluconolactonase [Sulfitobacter noctilucicola]MBB4173763.1 6-phosphogluconolactonase [Sulfitobacter noctilucicola]